MIIRQSTLKTFDKCALMYRWQHVDGVPRQQSASLTYGSLIHEAVLMLETTRDLVSTVAWFVSAWTDPESINPEYKLDYFVRGTNWKKYMEQGQTTLRNWWSLIQWDSDVVLGREYGFQVPIGDGHELQGTIDKVVLRYRPKINKTVILISDYKTNTKVPTYEWLEDDLQFTAYAYASHQPMFWDNMPNGAALFQQYKDAPRFGEWVSLSANKRMDAGERTQQQFNRLEYLCNQFAMSVAMRIFVPTLTGETCRWCDFRDNCGLQPIEG